MSYSAPGSVEELVLRWTKRVRESQFSHYDAAEVLGRWHGRLGLPVVVLSAVVGTSLFASLAASDPTTSVVVRVIAGAVSLAAAALGSVQTFLKYSEKAEKHRSAAARYGAIRRELELMVASKRFGDDQLEEVRKAIDSLSAEAPEVPKYIFARTEAYLKEHEMMGTDAPGQQRSGPAV
jgi:hypothetical protein